MRQEESRPCRSNVSACSRFREQGKTLYLQSANKLQYLEVSIKNMFWLILFFSPQGIKE